MVRTEQAQITNNTSNLFMDKYNNMIMLETSRVKSYRLIN